MKLHSVLILGFVFLPLVLYSRPHVNITRTYKPPVIDGVLSEDTWLQATPITLFVQREPDTGKPVSEKTEFFLLYDEYYLYIGIRCYDDPTGIMGKEMARNTNLSYDDKINIIIDTYLDGRNAYWFQIGVMGSIGDAIISENGAGFNREWKGLWEGKSSIQTYGWEAEMALPFKTLNFDEKQLIWGIKFIRNIQRKLETSYWPTANLNSHPYQVSDAGLLIGMKNISQGFGLDINPYAISGHDHYSHSNSYYMADAGVDLFYQLTPGLRSVLTLNTDFAEAEVDTRQINLTRFSLHFPEKRDFFLDGGNYFNFGISGDLQNPYSQRLIPFFSRRLGLDTDGKPLPVHAGGRVTGQSGHWNLGFLNIFQEKIFDNRNYTAMRISRNIGNQSSAGMIATFGNAVGEGSNSLYGLDAKIASSSFAGDKNLAFILYGLQSVTEKPGNERLANNAFGAELSYPNDKFYGRAGLLQIDQDFIAGMGFVPRKGIREFYFSAGVGPRPGRWGILQIRTYSGIDFISDLNGVLQTREIELTPMDVRFRKGERLTVSTILMHENLQQDFILLNIMTIPADQYDFRINKLSISSAKQKNLWGGFSYEWGDFFKGKKKNLSMETGWQAFVHLFLGAETEKSNIRFTDRNINVGIYRLIMNILINPQITLYNFIQYDDISEIAGWQSRFQYIIKPGREVLLAWNSNISDPMERYTISESSLRLKLKYNMRF